MSRKSSSGVMWSESSSRPPGCGKIAMSGASPLVTRWTTVSVKSVSAVYFTSMPDSSSNATSDASKASCSAPPKAPRMVTVPSPAVPLAAPPPPPPSSDCRHPEVTIASVATAPSAANRRLLLLPCVYS